MVSPVKNRLTSCNSQTNAHQLSEVLDLNRAAEHCESMRCCSFTGRIFTEQVAGGQAEVDIEFTRSGFSSMTATGQLFEIAFSQCELRFGGVGRRLLFCRNHDRTLTVCCGDVVFPRALSEASFGLLDVQLERQLRKGKRQPSERSLLGLNALVGMAMLVAGAYLIAIR